MLVEARLDVALHDPLVGAGREVVHLGDRVLRPASGPEPVGARLEVASKIGSSTSLRAACTTRSRTVGDPQPAQLAAALGDRPLP